MNEALLSKCLEAWPDRPKLDPAEWPYTREGLEGRITECVDALQELIDMGRHEWVETTQLGRHERTWMCTHCSARRTEEYPV